MFENLFHLFEFHYDLVGIGSLLTFLTVLFTFYKQVAVPMYDKTLKPMALAISNIYNAPKRINSLDAKLDIIISELRPNGGGSMRDSINRMEDSMAVSTAQRYILLNAMPHGAWTFDCAGNCTWINDPLKKTLGVTMDDMGGSNWTNYLCQDTRDAVVREWKDAVQARRKFDTNFKFCNPQTMTEHLVHSVSTPILNFKGEVVGWTGLLYFS
jgi:PAS domain-containing protein